MTISVAGEWECACVFGVCAFNFPCVCIYIYVSGHNYVKLVYLYPSMHTVCYYFVLAAIMILYIYI